MSSDPSALTAGLVHLCCIVGGASLLLASLVWYAIVKLTGGISDE